MAKRSWLTWLTDRLVLEPSTHEIPNPDLQRELVPTEREGESLELWSSHVSRADPQAAKLLMIKFPGTGGRAERSTTMPVEHWSEFDSIVWTINPFGYGGSPGPATLQRFPEMVDCVASAAQRRHPDRTVLVYGNSLGGISALAYAAAHPVGAVYLRNPVPIHQMIRRRPRYAWPSLGLSRLIASRIPDRLDAVQNASVCGKPALFVSSLMDRVVPVAFQQEIYKNYQGPSRIFRVAGIGHHDPVPENERDAFVESLDWLRIELAQVIRSGSRDARKD